MVVRVTRGGGEEPPVDGERPPAKKKAGRPVGAKDKKPRTNKTGVFAVNKELTAQNEKLLAEVASLKKQLAEAAAEKSGLKGGAKETLKQIGGAAREVPGIEQDIMPAMLSEAIASEGGLAGEIATGDMLAAERLDLRRKQVLRLCLRGVPRLTMADQLKISIATLDRDILAVRAELKKGLDTYDLQYEVAMAIKFYDECKQVALRIATDPTVKKPFEKIQATRMAMDAETNKQRFLSALGLYSKRGTDELGFTSAPADGSTRDSHELMALFEGLLVKGGRNAALQ